MREFILLLLVLIVAAGGLGLATSAGAEGSGALPPSRLATLYHFDPLTRALSLGSGEPGSVFQDHAVCNRQSDLDFGHYNEGEFSVGIEGGRLGVILDLGPSREVAGRYEIPETVGGGQAYASIRIEDSKLVIAGRGKVSAAPIAEAEMLFLRPKSCAHAPVVQDHIYLVRLTDRNEPEFERIAKMLVVSHDAEAGAVTIRWDLLKDARKR